MVFGTDLSPFLPPLYASYYDMDTGCLALFIMPPPLYSWEKNDLPCLCCIFSKKFVWKPL